MSHGAQTTNYLLPLHVSLICLVPSDIIFTQSAYSGKCDVNTFSEEPV